VQSTFPEPDDEDDELQEVLEVSRRELSFKQGRESAMSMVVDVGEEGKVE
jgi:hypothetical protein